MEIVYLVALALSALLAMAGIFNRQFDDNFMQRIGLAILGIAACFDLTYAYLSTPCCEAANGKSLFVIGFAVYGMGTFVKVHRHARTKNDS